LGLQAESTVFRRFVSIRADLCRFTAYQQAERVGTLAGMEASRLLRVSEVAEQLAVREKTVYRLIRDGELRAIRVGGRFRIEPEALADYIERNRTGS
jgi:excisionase family DNA binding protein